MNPETTPLPISDDARDFAARQFALEFESGATLNEAATRLRQALTPNLHWSIDEVERLFAGGAPRAAQPQLAAVLEEVRRIGARPEAAFVAYQRSAREVGQLATGVLSGARTFGGYLLGMVLVLALIVTVYTLFVLPKFQSMFDQFGTPLPRFTATLLGSQWVLLPGLLVLVLILLWYFRGLGDIRRRLLELLPLKPVLRFVPGFGAWADDYDASLWMRYQTIFLDVGMGTEAAHAAATRLTGEPSERRRRLLKAAAALGRLRAELGEQLARADRRSLDGFEQSRNTAVLLMRVFVYLLVSGYIIAMYLPIFKLGAVV